MNIHKPVLLTESITALAIKPDGHYLDATFGRGGHSRAILANLGPNGRLVSMDKDPDAIREGERLAKEDQRFTICHASFAELAKWVGWKTRRCVIRFRCVFAAIG